MLSQDVVLTLDPIELLLHVVVVTDLLLQLLNIAFFSLAKCSLDKVNSLAAWQGTGNIPGQPDSVQHASTGTALAWLSVRLLSRGVERGGRDFADRR